MYIFSLESFFILMSLEDTIYMPSLEKEKKLIKYSWLMPELVLNMYLSGWKQRIHSQCWYNVHFG